MLKRKENMHVALEPEFKVADIGKPEQDTNDCKVPKSVFGHEALRLHWVPQD